MKKEDEIAHVFLCVHMILELYVHSRCLLIINTTIYLCFLAFLLRVSAL